MANLCVTPSADLLAHEWAKHGSCLFSDAPRYFRAASVMFDAVRFPDMDRLSRRNPTAGDIRRAFAARNPGLPDSAGAVVANRRQGVQEARLGRKNAVQGKSVSVSGDHGGSRKM